MKHLAIIMAWFVTMSTAHANLYVSSADDLVSNRLHAVTDAFASVDVDFHRAYQIVPGLTPYQFERADENQDGRLNAQEFRKLVY